LASSAALSITGSAHIQALHGKTQQMAMAVAPAIGENFAELLAHTGDSQLQMPAQLPAQPTDKNMHAALQLTHGAKAETAPQVPDGLDAAVLNSEAPDVPIAEKAEPEARAEDAKPAASNNDNQAAADLLPQASAPQVQTQAKPKETATPPTDDAQHADISQAVVMPATPVLATATPITPALTSLTPAALSPVTPSSATKAPANAAAINKSAPNQTSSEDDLDATDETKAAPEFEQALQDAKAEPRAVSIEAAAPKPAEMKPAADFASIVPGANTNMAGIEKPAQAAQTASQDLKAPLPAPDVNQFAVEVAAKSQAGAKQFDIRLDPPELGRVDVRLSIDATGKAEAHLTADQPATLDLLQKDAPALMRALRDAGLDLAQNGLNFSLKNQQQQAGDDGARQQGGRQASPPRVLNEPAETAAHVRRPLGLLDIRV